MVVKVTLGVPEPFLDAVDDEKVRAVFPYGTVEVRCTVGGLIVNSGVELPDQDDAEGDARALVVVSAVEVFC